MRYKTYANKLPPAVSAAEAALTEADADDFASEKDVGALARKWQVNAR